MKTLTTAVLASLIAYYFSVTIAFAGDLYVGAASADIAPTKPAAK